MEGGVALGPRPMSQASKTCIHATRLSSPAQWRLRSFMLRFVPKIQWSFWSSQRPIACLQATRGTSTVQVTTVTVTKQRHELGSCTRTDWNSTHVEMFALLCLFTVLGTTPQRQKRKKSRGLTQNPANTGIGCEMSITYRSHLSRGQKSKRREERERDEDTKEKQRQKEYLVGHKLHWSAAVCLSLLDYVLSFLKSHLKSFIKNNDKNIPVAKSEQARQAQLHSCRQHLLQW